MGILILFGIGCAVAFVWAVFVGTRPKAQQLALQGYLNKPVMFCPHCQTAGQVWTKAAKQKKGVSGAKATGAILTGGVSLLATGLSRKEKVTEATCANCDSNWIF